MSRPAVEISTDIEKAMNRLVKATIAANAAERDRIQAIKDLLKLQKELKAEVVD